MALCDQLEAAHTECEVGRDKLTLSTMAKLNEPDPQTFADDARFALEHLEKLTKRTDQIKQLRQTILNLAVRGKLVAQDPSDEPAILLIKELAADRGDGELRPSKVLDRKSVVEGKSVSVRVDLGGRRGIKKKTRSLKNK